MNLTVLNPDTLSLNDLVKDMDQLYYITSGDTYLETRGESGQLLSRTTKGLGLWPVSKHGITNLQNNDFLIVKITDGKMGEEVEDKSEEVPETPAIEEMRHRRTRVANRTYKLNSNNKDETIFVEYRPGTGAIRVNFKDKESAQTYFEYFREQFYTGTTGASVITVSNIYKDLNLVNWKEEDCDDWGWYTQDFGPCRKISEVLKTKNTKMYGFTLKCPEKLYETKKREEAN